MSDLSDHVLTVYMQTMERLGWANQSAVLGGASNYPLLGLAGAYGVGKSTLGSRLEKEAGWLNVDLASNIFQLVLQHKLPAILHPVTGKEITSAPVDYVSLKSQFPYLRTQMSDAVFRLRKVTGKDIAQLVLGEQHITGPTVVHSLHTRESAAVVRNKGGIVLWMDRAAGHYVPPFAYHLSPVHNDFDEILYV